LMNVAKVDDMRHIIDDTHTESSSAI